VSAAAQKISEASNLVVFSVEALGIIVKYFSSI